MWIKIEPFKEMYVKLRLEIVGRCVPSVSQCTFKYYSEMMSFSTSDQGTSVLPSSQLVSPSMDLITGWPTHALVPLGRYIPNPNNCWQEMEA